MKNIFVRKNSETDQNEVNAGAVAGAAFTAGATKNVLQRYSDHLKDKALPNSRSIADFKEKLQPGDILIMGSNDAGSGTVRVKDLPGVIRKGAKMIGKKDSDAVISNSSMLRAIGGGAKYHAGVYTGNGKVVHMSTDAGAVSESLDSALARQNTTALRLKSGNKTEIKSAVNFAKKMHAEKVPYQGMKEILKEPAHNYFLPQIPRAATRCSKDGLVCHTLPLMSYHKQKFSAGRRTLSGDIARNTNFERVAKRDVIKNTFRMNALDYTGQAAKGLKYALPAAGIAYGVNKYLNNRNKSEE